MYWLRRYLFVFLVFVVPAQGKVLTKIAVQAPASASLIVSRTLQLSAVGTYDDGSTSDITASVTWSSSDPAVMTVDPAGRVTGVAVGSASIVASAGGVNGVSSISVIQEHRLNSLKASADQTLFKGTTKQLVATGSYTDGSTEDVSATSTWTTSNPAVAAVSNSGVVIALAEGVAKVTVSRDGVPSADSTITVVAAPAPAVAAAADSTSTWSSLYTRAVAGLDISGGSSLATQQKFFLEFNVTAPMPLQRPADPGDHEVAKQCIRDLNEVAAEIQRQIPVSFSGAHVDNIIANAHEHCKDLDGTSSGIWSTVTDPDSFQSVASDLRRQYEYKYSPLARHAWFWMNPRISAIPSQVTNLLSTVTTPNTGVNTLLTQQYNQAIQDFEFTGGFEVRPFPSDRWANLGSNARLTMAVIGAAGFQTPLAATQTNAQIFVIPAPPSAALSSQLAASFPQITNICTGANPSAPAGCTNSIAFVPTNRTRFYYEDYLGLRLKTYYFRTKASSEMAGLCDSKQPGQLCPIFPGTFDITVGQNSAYTGGQLRHWLLRTEAFYPLPFNPAFHVFFTAWIHINGHNQNSTPLLLDTAASSVTVTSPGVQVIPLPATDRDYYRIGFGVDLVQMIKKFTAKPATAQSGASEKSAGTAGS